LRGGADEEGLKLAGSIVARYSKAKDQDRVEVQYGKNEECSSGRLFVSPAGEDQIAGLRF
jgi:hypothetical protein